MASVPEEGSGAAGPAVEEEEEDSLVRLLRPIVRALRHAANASERLQGLQRLMLVVSDDDFHEHVQTVHAQAVVQLVLRDALASASTEEWRTLEEVRPLRGVSRARANPSRPRRPCVPPLHPLRRPPHRSPAPLAPLRRRPSIWAAAPWPWTSSRRAATVRPARQ